MEPPSTDGGDTSRCAFWRIVMVRMSCDARTKAYVERRTTEGKTTKEIIRCLKRYVAREVYRAIAEQGTQAPHSGRGGRLTAASGPLSAAA